MYTYLENISTTGILIWEKYFLMKLWEDDYWILKDTPNIQTTNWGSYEWYHSKLEAWNKEVVKWSKVCVHWRHSTWCGTQEQCTIGLLEATYFIFCPPQPPKTNSCWHQFLWNPTNRHQLNNLDDTYAWRILILLLLILLVRPPWPHSMSIIGWRNSNPEQRL